MSELAAFLEARITEDEAAADYTHHTAPFECDIVFHAVVDPLFGWTCTCGVPARVLADCTARRQIIELHGVAKPTYERPPMCNMCGVADGYYDVPWPCPTLLALAAPYAGHDDFDPAWLA